MRSVSINGLRIQRLVHHHLQLRHPVFQKHSKARNFPIKASPEKSNFPGTALSCATGPWLWMQANSSPVARELLLHSRVRFDRQFTQCHQLANLNSPHKWRITFPAESDVTIFYAYLEEHHGDLRYRIASAETNQTPVTVELVAGFLGDDHTAKVKSELGETIGHATHLCLFLSPLTVYSSLHRCHGWCHPLRITRQHHQEHLLIEEPKQRHWSSLRVFWQGKEKEGDEVAHLHKSWDQRSFYADNVTYDVEFLNVEDEWRLLIVAAGLVIDWLYFQQF